MNRIPMLFAMLLLPLTAAQAGLDNMRSADTLAAKSDSIELPMVSVAFRTSTGRLISKAAFEFQCLRKATFFERFDNGLKDYMPCDNFQVTSAGAVGPSTTGLTGSGAVILEPAQAGAFTFPSVRFHYSNHREATLCMRLVVKAEGTDPLDETIFQNKEDRWGLHSFCTASGVPSYWPSRYIYRNIKPIAGFNETFRYPIEVALTR